MSPSAKVSLADFLAGNPYRRPYTEGLFYREKMRAIHRVAPDTAPHNLLEIGGGRSGLTTLLYPAADVVNIDLDTTCATAPANRGKRIRFVVGDATALPFPDHSFDGITMFDLIEHVPDDARAVAEAWRVLKPGGFWLITTPNENWKFPYHRGLQRICPPEEVKFQEWGHVRRGYSRDQLERLMGRPAARTATFINPVTVLFHDIGMSNLPLWGRRLGWVLLAAPTALAYAWHRPDGTGTETAYAWFKPASADDHETNPRTPGDHRD